MKLQYKNWFNWFIVAIAVPCTHAQEAQRLELPQDIYNATTTIFITQPIMQYNQGGHRMMGGDISAHNIHRFTLVQQYGNQLQDLGNNGTATKPIFYTIPEDSGLTSGFHAYEFYFKNADQLRYYNTKSPYSKIHAVLTRFGSYDLDVCYSININPRWNMGVNFRKMMTGKVNNARGRGDNHVKSHALDLCTHYKTDREDYQLLAHIWVAVHEVRETGGVYTHRYLNNKNLPNVRHLWTRGVKNRLETAHNLTGSPISRDIRIRIHAYQQLALVDNLWIYHTINVQDQAYTFTGFSLSKEMHEFLEIPTPNYGTGNINTSTEIQTKQQELGVKGHWHNWFYESYGRYRDVAWCCPYAEDNEQLREYYVGFYTRCHLLDETACLRSSGEYLWPSYYKVRTAYESQHWSLALERVRHKPSLLVQKHHSEYRSWGPHNYTPPTATRINGSFRLSKKGIRLIPHGSCTWVDHYIYFVNSAKKAPNAVHAIPQQASQHMIIVTGGTNLEIDFGKYFHWDSEIIMAKPLGPAASLCHIPAFLVNTKGYYEKTTPTDNGALQIGIDVHYKSAYQADTYDPVTQQFCYQNDFTVAGYPIIDLFLDFRINNATAFIKFSHCNEFWLAPAPGYWTTPFYPGKNKALDIGVTWSFFD